MNNVTNFILPNKNGKFTTREFMLEEAEFFSKFKELSSENGIDLVVSVFHKDTELGKHYFSKKQLFCIQFADYDSPNGDISYVLGEQDTEYDEEDRDETTRTLKKIPIESAVKIITSNKCANHFSVVIF